MNNTNNSTMENKDLMYFQNEVAQEMGHSDWFYLCEWSKHNGSSTIRPFEIALERYERHIQEQCRKATQRSRNVDDWMKAIIMVVLFIVAALARLSGNDLQATLYVCTSMIILFMPEQKKQ